MADRLGGNRIKSDNTYSLKPGNGNKRILAISETFDGASVTPGYINAANTFVGFKDENEAVITFTASFQIVQEGGIGMKYALQVTGSGGSTNLLVEQFETGR